MQYTLKKWVMVLGNDALGQIIIHEVWNKDFSLMKFYYVSIILRYFVIIFNILRFIF